MYRLLSPWLVLPLLVIGLASTWIVSEATYKEAETAWEKRIFKTTGIYSENIIASLDNYVILIHAFERLLKSDPLTNERDLDDFTNRLSTTHNEFNNISLYFAENQQGRWTTTALINNESASTESSLSLTNLPTESLNRCSQQQIALLLPLHSNMVLCIKASSNSSASTLLLAVPVKNLLNNTKIPKDWPFQLDISSTDGANSIRPSEAISKNEPTFTVNHSRQHFNGEWVFKWQVSRNMMNSPYYRPGDAVLVGGATITCLVSLLLLFLLIKIRGDASQASMQKRLLQQTKQERDKAQLYLDTAQVVIIGIDTNQKITLINRKTIDALGYLEHELLGNNFSILLSQDDIQPIKKHVENSRYYGNHFEGEGRLCTKSGAYRWFIWNNNPIFDENNNVIGFICSGQDITERKRLENALSELATNLSRVEGKIFLERSCLYLAEQLDMDIAFVGTLDRTKQQVTTISGYSKFGTFEPLTYSLIDTPCDSVLNAGICTFAENVSTLFPNDHLLKDMHIEGYLGAPLWDSNNQPIGILVLLSHNPILDLTYKELMVKSFLSRLETELQRMRDQEKLLLAHRMFQTSNDGFFVTDENGFCTEVNRAFVEISGYTEEEIVGNRINHFLLPPDADLHFDSINNTMLKVLNEENFWTGEYLGQRKNGDRYNYWVRINTLRDENNNITHYFGSITDITREKQTEKLLEQVSFYDKLTGLPNRTLLRERLQEQIRLCNKEQLQLAVLQIDLDNFKIVNETLGFHAGDTLAVNAAQRIQQLIGNKATLARIGGDEFTIILPAIDHTIEAAHLAEKLLDVLSPAYTIDSRTVYLGASIGIAIYPDDGNDSDSLLKASEIALYRAKEENRGSFNFYTHDMNAKSIERLTLEHELRHAIDNELLETWYQPKYAVSTKQIVGFEALVRWQHPTFGLISPSDFIPLAEETGLIIAIGEYVLHKSCEQLKLWHKCGYSHLHMAINLSPKQFQNQDLARWVESTLNHFDLPGSAVELEITESAAMENPEKAISIMETIRDIGVSISIDDFGTGYSSLNYLKRFPLQTLKIDQSFVRDLIDDSDDAAIVSSILSLAKSLNLQVVAEGVETADQFRFLKDNGCDYAQGYFLNRPMPHKDIDHLLAIHMTNYQTTI